MQTESINAVRLGSLCIEPTSVEMNVTVNTRRSSWIVIHSHLSCPPPLILCSSLAELSPFCLKATRVFHISLSLCHLPGLSLPSKGSFSKEDSSNSSLVGLLVSTCFFDVNFVFHIKLKRTWEPVP